MELAKLVSVVVGYQGKIVLDSSRPDGTPRKLLNVEKIRTLGWQRQVVFRQGIEATYRWLLDNIEALKNAR